MKKSILLFSLLLGASIQSSNPGNKVTLGAVNSHEPTQDKEEINVYTLSGDSYKLTQDQLNKIRKRDILK